MSLQQTDIRKYNYFATLSKDAQVDLSQKLKIMVVPANTEVIKEGAEGDAFYFVRDGRLEVTKQTKTGQSAKLSIIGSGQGFGEMSLLTGAVRDCSVRAMNTVTLYVLAKKDFEDLVRRESGFKNMLLRKAAEYAYYNKIKTLTPFALLEPDRMFALMSRMTEKSFSLGEDIIVQGDKGDYYYIIKTGRVAVLQIKKGSQDQKQVAMLIDGDGFGEEALIRDDPRNATCRAIEETTVYALDREDFNHILKGAFLDNIFAEDISVATYRERYHIIDARVPVEFEEEHIEGAENIPMEILRQKFIELDRSRNYITYCTNDARGMVAAYLLKNQGFKAKCLRGGISSWEGPVVRRAGVA